MNMKKSRLTTAIVATCCAAMLPTFAIAADEQKAERVEVVGSHIKRTDIEGTSPVFAVTRDEIEKSGYNNLQQLFERMPVTGAGTFSTRGNNQDSTANGGAAISLRGLGSDATLVLVNGRRVAISAFAESVTNNFVDINTIPMAAIERVEVLKDGASAIYGSDAVAGVINIVLRKDYEGSELTVSYGNTTDTDADEKNVSLLWGTSGQNGNATLILDYFSNSSLMNKDRGHLGSANQEPYGGFDLRSSRGFPGNYVVNGVTTIDPNCPAENAFGASCVYDYGPWAVLTPESERIGAILLANRDIGSNTELFTELSVQHNTSFAQGAPTPLDGDAGLTVPGTHPNNPFGVDIGINRHRTVDAGARIWDIETDVMRLVVGARGTIFNDWDWSATAQKGRSESMQTGGRHQGWVRTDLLQQEIDAGRYNPFGGTFNPPEVINAITTSLVRRGESHLNSYDAKLSGGLFDMAGGQAMLAAGVELITEKVSDVPDDQFQRGLIFGTESVSAEAKRDRESAFIEFVLPFADQLEVQLAGRYDKYDGFGAQFNPKVGALWTPTEDLKFRVSWGTGFRAPSLAQIGLGPSQESRFFLDSYRCPTPDPSNPACASTDYTIVFAGNPELDAEESESFNIGMVWQASDNASVTVDFWSIEQENKIAPGDFGALYVLECNNQASTICIRNAPLPGETLGALSRINNGYRNLNEQTAAGVDISADYRLDTAEMGVFKFKIDWTLLTEFEQELTTNEATGATRTLDWTGEYEYPEIRWVSSMDWTMDNFGAMLSVSYIGEFEDEPIDVLNTGETIIEQDARTVDAFMTVDMQVRYLGFEDTVLSFGIQNLLDEEPPFAIGDGDNDIYGYASQLHSPRGQFVYGEVTYRF